MQDVQRIYYAAEPPDCLVSLKGEEDSEKRKRESKRELRA